MPQHLDRTRMAASQVRKDSIYRRIDNYAYQTRRTTEEMAFAHRSEQLKHMVSQKVSHFQYILIS